MLLTFHDISDLPVGLVVDIHDLMDQDLAGRALRILGHQTRFADQTPTVEEESSALRQAMRALNFHPPLFGHPARA